MVGVVKLAGISEGGGSVVGVNEDGGGIFGMVDGMAVVVAVVVAVANAACGSDAVVNAVGGGIVDPPVATTGEFSPTFIPATLEVMASTSFPVATCKYDMKTKYRTYLKQTKQ